MKIFVASASFAKNASLLDELKRFGPPITVGTTNGSSGLVLSRELTEEELSEQIGDHEILLLGRTPLSRLTIQKLKKLRFVSTYGVGLDHIDLKALEACGIELGWTPGVNRRAVAELVLGVILNHSRNLSHSHNCMRQDQWIKEGGVGLDGLRIGIIGMGAIGSEVVKMLAPWDLAVIYHDIIDRKAIAGRAERKSFEEVVESSDIITLHVPLTPLTHLMLNQKTLNQIKETALLINTSRGSVVDFEAACAAVREHRLGGFAVDVYDKEPFMGASWNHPRIYLTPHIGGNSKQAVQMMGQAAMAQIRSYINRFKIP